MKVTSHGFELLDFDPRNLPPEHLQAIGLMSAAASSTDSIVEMAIAGLLGIDGEMGYAVSAHMPAPLRTSVLKSAAEIVFKEAHTLDALDDILEAIKKATEQRNDYVHGTWCMRESDGAVLLVQQEARTHVVVSSKPVTVNQIKSKAIALYDAGMDLMGFLIATNKVPALPDATRIRGVNTPKARKAARKKKGE